MLIKKLKRKKAKLKSKKKDYFKEKNNIDRRDLAMQNREKCFRGKRKIIC
ncbi:MAG: hypothetical protein L6V91_03100 [Bacilli bacterium]|nr:MAG: hypothetical protein L6V91_03100 [Bacilli bacterium]